MGAGSDERAECVCAREPEGQAPVGVRQSVLITLGCGGWEEEEAEGAGRGEGTVTSLRLRRWRQG